MRNEYAVSCGNCGFDKSFISGNDLKYSSLESLIDRIHPMRRPKLIKLMDEHTVHETGCEHRIYHCEQCGQLRNSFWAKVVYDDGEVYETHFHCGKCRKPMMNISGHLALSNKYCPCCGEMKLRVEEKRGWDLDEVDFI